MKTKILIIGYSPFARRRLISSLSKIINLVIIFVQNLIK